MDTNLLGQLSLLELNNLQLPELKKLAVYLNIPLLNKRKDVLIDDISKTLILAVQRQVNPYQVGFNFVSFDFNYLCSDPHLRKILEKYQEITQAAKSNLRFGMNQPMMQFPPQQHDYFGYNPLLLSHPYLLQQNLQRNTVPVPTIQTKVNDGKTCLCGMYVVSTQDSLVCINKECQRKVHANCAKVKLGTEDAKIYECVECVLYRSDPLHEVRSVLKSPVLLNNLKIEFSIDKETYTAISSNENIGIEIRCIRLEEKSIEPTWPHQGELQLNGRRELEFRPLQINSSLKKRKDEKFFTRNVSFGTNSLVIKFYPRQDLQKGPETYYCGIFVVKRLLPEDLINKVKKTSNRSIEECKKRVIEQFDVGGIQIDKLSYPLTCVLDMQPLKTPAKGVHCKHVNCFSLENFVNVWHKNNQRKWQCPLCKLKAYDIIVDSYFLEILQAAEELGVMKSEYPEVTFDSTGEYTFKGKEKELQKLNKEQKNRAESASLQDSKTKKDSNRPAQKKPEEALIVLDDSEEEEEKESPPKPQNVEPSKAITNVNNAQKENEKGNAVRDTKMVMEEILDIGGAHQNNLNYQVNTNSNQNGYSVTLQQQQSQPQPQNEKAESDISSVIEIELLPEILPLEINQENAQTQEQKELEPAKLQANEMEIMGAIDEILHQPEKDQEFIIEKEAVQMQLEKAPSEPKESIEIEPLSITTEVPQAKDKNDGIQMILESEQQMLSELFKYSEVDAQLPTFDDFLNGADRKFKPRKIYPLATKKKLVRLFQRYFQAKKKSKPKNGDGIIKKTISKNNESPKAFSKDTEKSKLTTVEALQNQDNSTSSKKNLKIAEKSFEIAGESSNSKRVEENNTFGEMLTKTKGNFSDPICLD